MYRRCGRDVLWLLAGLMSLGMALSGCAGTAETQEPAYGVGGPPVAAPPPPPQPPAEVEDDGLPPQSPPLRRSNAEPDDPNEPFSPNYGAGPRLSAAAPSRQSETGPGTAVDRAPSVVRN